MTELIGKRGWAPDPAPPPSEPKATMGMKIGQIIDDKYEIVRLVGEGGMGAVYEGRNRFISRTVAIKVLLPAAIDADPTAVRRFEREAQAAGRIGSDHILEVLDLGSLPGGERYLVMEYLEGETLAARIHRLGRMSPRELLPILIQALHGLTAAHRAGIVHRDLKPDNLFILKEKAGTQDFVKLIDFGISKFSDGPGSELSMTRTGALMGTPYYMSPEQAKGAENVNHQTDLYSLGVIAFEAVTGRVPYDGNTFNDLMFKIVLSAMPNPEDLVGGLDPAFCAIVRRAMDRDLGRRFGSAEDFLAALERWSPMALTVADGTPMSVQGAGMTGDFGVQTLGQGDGLLGTRVRSAVVEPTDARPRGSTADPADHALPSSSNVSSEATLAATSVAHEVAIPSTQAKAQAEGRALKDKAARDAPNRARRAPAQDEAGITLLPETADTGGGPAPQKGERPPAARTPARRSGTLASADGVGPGPKLRPGRPRETMPDGPPTEPLPLRKSAPPRLQAALVVGAVLALAAFLIMPSADPEDDAGDPSEPETAALQKAGADQRGAPGASSPSTSAVPPVELPADLLSPATLETPDPARANADALLQAAPALRNPAATDPGPDARPTTTPLPARPPDKSAAAAGTRPAPRASASASAPKSRTAVAPSNVRQPGATQPSPAQAPAGSAARPPGPGAASFPDAAPADPGPRDFGY